MPATETRRKTKSRSRAKKISIDDAEKQKEEAVQAALAKAKEDWEREQAEDGFEDPPENNDFGFETLGYEERNDDEELRSQNEAASSWDLFDWIEKNYYQHGIPVIYQIKKNGEVQGQMEHPCSWKSLQETFGGGQYQVIAKTAMEKEYIKSQRQMVRAPLQNGKDKDQEPRVISPPQSSMDMNQMFTGMMGMFTQMQEMVAKERTREEREDKKSSESFNTTFLTLMQNQQKATSDMFLKIAEMSTNTSKDQSSNFAKVIEKMDDKFTRMFEKLADGQNKTPDFTVKDILDMTQSAEDRGRSLMETVMELADAKAERLAESEGDSKDSLLASLVKGFAPILTQANKSMQAAQTVPRGSLPSQPTIPQIPAQPRNPGYVRAAQSPGVTSRPGVKQAPRQSRQWREENFSAGALGLATFTDNEVSAGSVSADVNDESLREPVIPHTLEGLDFEAENSEEKEDVRGKDIYEEASVAQRTIAELAIPLMAIHMMDDEISPEASAEIVLLEVGSQGFSPEVVVKEFGFDFMLKIASEFGLGEERKPWLERFYAKIYDTAGDGTQREEESSLS